MFCSSCGNKVSSKDAKFCNKCGSLLGGVDVVETPNEDLVHVEKSEDVVEVKKEEVVEKKVEEVKKDPVEPVKAVDVSKNDVKPKKFTKMHGVIVGLLLVLIVGAASWYMLIGSKTKLDPQTGLDYFVKGGNGHGTLVVTGNAFGLGDNETTEVLFRNGEVKPKYQDLMNSLVFEILDKDGNVVTNGTLSNGDAVRYSIRFDEDLLKELKMRLVNNVVIVPVEGLPDVNMIDFKDMTHVEWTFNGQGNPVLDVDLSNVPWKGDIKAETKSMSNGVAVVSFVYDKDAMLQEGYLSNSDTDTFEFEVGEMPKMPMNLEDAALVEAIRAVTDPVVEARIHECSDHLELDGVQYPIIKNDFIKVEFHQGKISAHYRTHLAKDDDSAIYSKFIQVDAYQMGDGSYRVNLIEPGTGCVIVKDPTRWG